LGLILKDTLLIFLLIWRSTFGSVLSSDDFVGLSSFGAFIN
jgi:hypothetical protein